MKNIYLYLFIGLLASSCDDHENALVTADDSSPNILLIIADDLGKDAISGFTEGSIKPVTPHIDALRNNGISFTNFWTNPTCTPTRASIITGKYGYRTGVKGVGDVLSTSELTLHDHVKATNSKYTTAIVGKWHLSGNAQVNPEDFGMDYYAGLIRGAVDDYYRWQLNVRGETSQSTGYITEVFTDLAIEWLQDQASPWFLWLAYTAPHTPFHAPPGNMHSRGNLTAYANGLDATPYYMAAIEAMDYQIGRLLDSMSEDELNNTLIIFIGDNGTPGQVAQSPYESDKVKNTLYQGGINAPMFVSGKMVNRHGEDDHLLVSADLFATIGQVAGGNEESVFDSRSFLSLLTEEDVAGRTYQYSEQMNGNIEEWCLSDGTYKIIADVNGVREMYHLSEDPYETVNILNTDLSEVEIKALTTLEEKLSDIRN